VESVTPAEPAAGVPDISAPEASTVPLPNELRLGNPGTWSQKKSITTSEGPPAVCLADGSLAVGFYRKSGYCTFRITG